MAYEAPRSTNREYDAQAFPRTIVPDYIKTDGPPRYGGYEGNLEAFDYNLERQLSDVASVERGALARARSNGERMLIEQDFETTRQFILRAHNEYRNPPANRHSHVFAVPMRINRENYYTFLDEADEHTPFAKHCSPADGIRILANLSPVVLDTYEEGGGAILLMPLFEDISRDLSRAEQMIVGSKLINDTAAFAAQIGATVIGLGGTIPKMTRFGRLIAKPEGVATTTGHGGTVYCVERNVDHIFETRSLAEDITIAVLGAGGSIGSASLETLIEPYPKVTFKVTDTRPRALRDVVERLSRLNNAKIEIARNNAEAIAGSSLVVSAVLGTLSLHQMGLTRTDVADTTFLDDTQPPAIDLAEARSLDATVAWPVARDNTGGHMTTRRITLGRNNGLGSRDTVFGCAFETYAVSQHPELAIDGPVKPEMVRRLAQTAGNAITVDRLVSFGRTQE